MANIHDVANKARVSKTLVSRVINNRKGVSPEARERILKAMRELNYRPNGLARSLVLQKTQTIGVILDSLCASFFFELIRGFEEGAEEAGYNVIFCGGKNNPEVKHRYVDFFTQGRVDGIVIYGSIMTDDELIRELSASKFPFVVIENEIKDLDINNILVDNFGGAYKATEHLIKLGHRDVIHFAGDMNIKVSLDRLNGYVRAMQDNGVRLGEGMIHYTDFSEKSGYECMKSIIDKGAKPSAVFFGADITAFGAIRAINEAGLNIPGDIALVGFDDDIPESRDMVFPELTTIRQPLRAMGNASIKLLAKSIACPSMKPEKIFMETELVIRKSCGMKGV